MKHHGAILSKLLDDRGIQPADLARETGITPQQISQYRKMSVIPVKGIKKICDYFKIDYNTFPKSNCEDQLQEKSEEVAVLQNKIIELQDQLLKISGKLLEEKDEKSHLAMECVKLQHELQLLTGKNLVEAFQVLAAEHPEIYKLKQG